MMQVSELARVWRETVTARVTAQPKAVAQAFHVGQVDLPPGIVLGFVVPHGRQDTTLKHLRFWHLADTYAASENVRFRG